MLMKKVKIKRGYKDKFIVVVSYPNFENFPHDGTFSMMHEYYIVDSETELIEELNKEASFLVEDIEGIYYNDNNVSNSYLAFDEAGAFYRCKTKYKEC